MISVVVASGSASTGGHLIRRAELEAGVSVVAACCTASELERTMRELRPQLLLLDMQLPRLDEMTASWLDHGAHATICVTRFDQLIVSSVERHGVPYVLKPVSNARLTTAFAIARDVIDAAATAAAHAALRGALAEIHQLKKECDASLARRRIAVADAGAVTLIEVGDIDWIETDDNHLRIHTNAGSHVLRMTAAAIERWLDPREFVRIHRRRIVNVDRVTHVRRAYSGDAVVVLRDGRKLGVSRTHYHAVQTRLSGPTTSNHRSRREALT